MAPHIPAPVRWTPRVLGSAAHAANIRMALPWALDGNPTIFVGGCLGLPADRTKPAPLAGRNAGVRNAAHVIPPLGTAPSSPMPAPSRRRLTAEVLIVLGLSLGASAAYSIVGLANRLTRDVALGDQTTTINNPLSERPVFDLIYQLMGIFFDLMPVALVCFLLWQATKPRLGRLGIDFTRPGRDSLYGVGLALLIGVPGIAVYLGGRAIGITLNVVPTALDAYWWTIPVLLLSAARAGISEEVIVIGYLFARLRDLGWNRWQIIFASAALRGSYHLYQGFGAFVGNFAMGVFFGWLYTRFGRLLPLVIAHFVIDAAIFVGYPWAAATFPALFSQ